MLIAKLFIFTVVESVTLQQILKNLPSVKRGGIEPLYSFRLEDAFDHFNGKHDFVTHLTVTKKVKVGQPLRKMLSELAQKPFHQTQHRRISEKRSSRFNRFRKYHSK